MYSIKINTTDDYTEVIVEGKRRPGYENTDGAEGWSSIANHCNENKVEKLLVISKLTGHLPSMSSYDIASSFHHLGLNKDLKIALVDSIIDTFDTNRFSSNFAIDKGFNIKVFNNRNEAMNWLIQ
jgi:hypothetical protein